jgi:4a-hydroxytetrahydrobiopterin dehydratase
MSNTEAIVAFEEEIEASLKNLPGWTIVKGPKLQKRFEFKNFVEAFGFMTKVALVAESMDHHPEWTNVYSVVTISLYKHDECAITHKDIELAMRINQVLEQ